MRIDCPAQERALRGLAGPALGVSLTAAWESLHSAELQRGLRSGRWMIRVAQTAAPSAFNLCPLPCRNTTKSLSLTPPERVMGGVNDNVHMACQSATWH